MSGIARRTRTEARAEPSKRLAELDIDERVGMVVRVLHGDQRRDVARTGVIIFDLVELIRNEILQLDQQVEIRRWLVVPGHHDIERINPVIGHLGNAKIGLLETGLDGEMEAGIPGLDILQDSRPPVFCPGRI